MSTHTQSRRALYQANFTVDLHSRQIARPNIGYFHVTALNQQADERERVNEREEKQVRNPTEVKMLYEGDAVDSRPQRHSKSRAAPR